MQEFVYPFDKNIPPVNDHQVIDTLNHLIEVNCDAIEGYQTAASAVQNNEYAQMLREYSQQRDRFVVELSNLVVRHGGTPQTSGRLAGLLQRAWLNIKSSLTQGDGPILAECSKSEESLLKVYQEALSRNLPDNVREVLQQHESELRLVCERLRTITVALNN